MTKATVLAIRALASELRSDAGSAMLPNALSTGLVIAVIVLVGETSIASIIFSGSLSSLVPRGTGAILFGTLVMCFLTALACTYKGTISVPHFAPAAVLVTVGAAVAAVMVSASSEAVFATMIVIVGLSTLATAICYLLIGHFRLAHLFRFMPYPLVDGFLAGVGWFLAKSSVAVASGVTMTWETLPTLAEIETIQKWAPGVFYGVLLLVVVKVRPHYLILPGSAVLAVGICHATLFALDIPLAEATAAGILFAGLPAGSAWPPIGLDDLALVDWGVVTSQLPGIFAVMLVALISLVFCAGGLELISGVEIDLNREFRAEGVPSLLAGLGGSAPGCNSIPNSAISHATGAESRLTGITVAFVVGMILFVASDVVALLPTPVLAGLVLFVGLNLLYEVLVSNRKTLPWLDYGIVLAVSLVIVVVGFLEGVAVGLAAAVVFFVVCFSKVSVIDSAFTLRERRSRRARSATHRAILRHQGERVWVCRLRGYVIFGNAAPIGRRLNSVLKSEPPPPVRAAGFRRGVGIRQLGHEHPVPCGADRPREGNACRAQRHDGACPIRPAAGPAFTPVECACPGRESRPRAGAVRGPRHRRVGSAACRIGRGEPGAVRALRRPDHARAGQADTLRGAHRAARTLAGAPHP